MKRSSKKPDIVEAGSKKPESEDFSSGTSGSEKTTSGRNGIDAIQALIILGGAIIFLVIVWFVLHNILHIV
jgi:hypothetical protein